MRRPTLMLRALIPVLSLACVTLAHAGPPEQTIRIKQPSGQAVPIGPAPRLFVENAGTFALTGDHLVAVERSSLVARALPSGRPRVLGPAPAWFATTPDGSRVVSMGPAGLWSLQSDDAEVSHNGNGIPDSVSDDGKWLLYQHGCVFDAIRVDGSKTRELGFSGATLVGTVVTGDIRPEGSKGEPISLGVVELNTGARWSMEGIRLHPTHWRLPGTENLVMVDERGRLLLVELRAKKVTVLREAAPRAVAVSVRPDGRLLVVTRDDQERICGLIEFDPTSRKMRPLLDATSIQQCFAHPTREGTIFMAWRWSPQKEAVLIELDSQGNARQLGAAMADIGNLFAAGGRWVFQPHSKRGFVFTAP